VNVRDWGEVRGKYNKIVYICYTGWRDWRCKMNKSTLVVAVLIMMLPLGAYAGTADSIGNGISNIVGGIGDAVKDVGNGVGSGVSDIGNGVGNAFSGGKTTNTVATSDTAITNTANGTIQKLSDEDKIKSGYDLQIVTVNGAVAISGAVVDAMDINTIKNSVMTIPGVKSVSTENIKVR